MNSGWATAAAPSKDPGTEIRLDELPPGRGHLIVSPHWSVGDEGARHPAANIFTFEALAAFLCPPSPSIAPGEPDQTRLGCR
ncbi:hypothetical protein RRG08_018027 [Elysia crispata]|uniref:Uncharacterized protein n=1 Tax=Elysia crispata TaxID=231223 RepID=A0AAE0ZE80_9GAST|nr:hypothetical protein RRG08_018027 [Elysia crispata]